MNTMKNKFTTLNRLDKKHHLLFRDPWEAIYKENGHFNISPRLLQYKCQGHWWEILHKLRIRLLISREYEHFVLSLGANKNSPKISYMPLPHPSGIAVNKKRKTVYIASTRNPNQIFTLTSISGLFPRHDIKIKEQKLNFLLPMKTNFYPGSLYLHDLTFFNDRLYGNAVGHNAVVEIDSDGDYKYVWWPKCVEHKRKLQKEANYLQLNSIAAGKTIRSSFFTASSDKIIHSRPGNPNFPVNKRGVLFSAKTREPICFGLTRPHSARLHQGKVWLDNSGYGEFGVVDNNKFKSVIKLPGWTRGLCIYKGIAFVGTSRVIPRFFKYAPGLDVKKSICGIFAVDLKSSKILGSIVWPLGNQIFAIEALESHWASGFIHSVKPSIKKTDPKLLFYAFKNKG